MTTLDISRPLATPCDCDREVIDKVSELIWRVVIEAGRHYDLCWTARIVALLAAADNIVDIIHREGEGKLATLTLEEFLDVCRRGAADA